MSTDRHEEDSSITGTFYIPNEAETEESHSKALPRHIEKETDQVDFPDYQVVSNISDESFDEKQKNKIESTVEPSTEMAFGEPYIIHHLVTYDL